MNRRKYQKRESPSLIVDVWSIIVEYVDIDQIVAILRLCNGIHKLVDSNFSWKKRTEREYPNDMISTVRQGLEDERFKSIYRELRFHHHKTLTSGEFGTLDRSNSQTRLYDDSILNKSPVRETFFPHLDGRKEDIELSSFSNRFMDDYLKGWFSIFPSSSSQHSKDTKKSINFQVVSVCYVPRNVLNTNDEYRVRKIAIQFGVVVFQFFPIGLSSFEDNFNELFHKSMCYVGLTSYSDKVKETMKKKVRSFDLRGSAYLSRRNAGPLPFNRWTRFYNIIRQFSRDAQVTTLKEMATSKRPFQQRDIFSKFSTSSSKKREYCLSFESISLSRDDKKGVERGKIKLSLEEDSELKFLFYSGTLSFTTKLEEMETVYRKSTNYIFGTVLEDYVTFSVYDRQHNELLFYLGGKMEGNGEITGFLYQPEKNWKEIHRVFTMRMKK